MALIFGREPIENQFVNFAFPLHSYGGQKKHGLMSTDFPPGVLQSRPQQAQISSPKPSGLHRGWTRGHLIVRTIIPHGKLRLY